MRGSCVGIEFVSSILARFRGCASSVQKRGAGLRVNANSRMHFALMFCPSELINVAATPQPLVAPHCLPSCALRRYAHCNFACCAHLHHHAAMRTLAHSLDCHFHQNPHILLKIAKKAVSAAFKRKNYDAASRIIPYIVLDEGTTLVRPHANCPIQ